MTDDRDVITCDLHLHTRFSDGRLTVAELIDLYGQGGFDAIAITDHLCAPKNFLGIGAKILNRTLSFANWKEYTSIIKKESNRAWREYKMLVLTGVEYTNNTFNHSRNAHMLAIDVQEFVSPYLDEVAWLKEMKAQGALTVAAHPLKLKDASSQTYYLIQNQKTFGPLIDAWEVANHKTIWREMFATDFSLIACSDFHTQANGLAWRTRISCEKDPEAIKAFFKNRHRSREFIFTSLNSKEVRSSVVHSRLFKPEVLPVFSLRSS